MTRNSTGTQAGRAQRIICVTGPSGAGRNTAIRALEDSGFEAIDNLPLSLLTALLETQSLDGPIVLGLDIRNREFSVAGVLDAIVQLQQNGAEVELVFLECRTEVLIRRYSETRRRHPLSPSERPADGIAQEQSLLRPLRDHADAVIDTSEMTPHDLRDAITRAYSTRAGARMTVSVQSFSYKRGLPHGADMVFDCRFLRNPHWCDALRSKTGKSAEVAAYVSDDARYEGFYSRVLALAEFLLPAYLDEGKSHLALAFGCTGGKHRSVVFAEALARGLLAQDWDVSVQHRELERVRLGTASARAGGAA